MIPRRRGKRGCRGFALGLAVLFSLQQTTTTWAAEVVFGLQLDDDAGDTYGSSMSYDANTHRLYITGGTYSDYFKSGVGEISRRGDDVAAPKMSDCFFGVLQLPQQVFMSPQWIRRVQIGMPDVSEACSALYVSQLDGDIYLLGHSTHSASVLSPLETQVQRSNESPTPRAEGLMMHLTRGGSLVGGALMNSDAGTTYPIAIQGDTKTDNLFVVSIKSDDVSVNPNFASMKSRSQATQLDMSTAGYLPPEYGSNYTIVVKSMKREENHEERQALNLGNLDVRETLRPTWSKEFGMDIMPKSIQISGLLHVSTDVLAIAGSTHRSQTEFGEDFDGFLLLLHPESGEQVGSHRIRSIPHGDDRILGMCKDETDAENIYVVGITESKIHYYGMTHQSEDDSKFQKGAYRAFILKLNVKTMDTAWIEYVDGKYDAEESTQPPQVHGMACAVTPDGETVYMSGTVKEGAVMFFESKHAAYVDAKSHGGDDIFIAQYEAGDGTLNYAKQLGTMHDDSLGQGVSLVTNANGDAIILGNTNGSLMRQKGSSETTDMFVLSLARKRGHHLPFYEMMMDTDPTTSSQGFSKSTNPFYVVEKETDTTEPISDIGTASATGIISDPQSGQVSVDQSQSPIVSVEVTTDPDANASPEDTTKGLVQASVTRPPVHAPTTPTGEPTATTTSDITTTTQPTQDTNTQTPTNQTPGTPPPTTSHSSTQTQVNQQTQDSHFKDALDGSSNETLVVKTNETTSTILVNGTVSPTSGLNATGLFEATMEDNSTQDAMKDQKDIADTTEEVHEDNEILFTANATKEVLVNRTSTPPRKNPEQPSSEAESGTSQVKPPEVYGEPSELPSVVETTESPQPTEEIVKEAETIRPTSYLRSEAPGVSPSIVSSMPTSAAPTPQTTEANVVLVASSDPGNIGDEDSSDNQKMMMPYVIVFIVLGNIIAVVGMISLYLYRRKSARRRTKIAPELEGKGYPETLSKEFVNKDSDSDTDILDMMGEGRWRTDNAEALDGDRDEFGPKIEYSESYETQDGLLLMEMRPPQPPEALPRPVPPMPTLSECTSSDDYSGTLRHALDAFGKGQAVCRSKLWGVNRAPSLGPLAPSFSSVVDIDEDSIDGTEDKYAKEEQPGDYDYIDKYEEQSPS